MSNSALYEDTVSIKYARISCKTTRDENNGRPIVGTDGIDTTGRDQISVPRVEMMNCPVTSLTKKIIAN